MGRVLTGFFFYGIFASSSTVQEFSYISAFVLGPWVSVHSLNQVVKELQNTVQGLEDIKVLLKVNNRR